MGFINTVAEVFKESIKPKLDWRSNASGVSTLFSKERVRAAVAMDIDDQEFMQRYKNVRFSSISAAFFMLISLISVPMAHSMMGFFTALISALLFFLFYFRYAFLMWVCRDCWGRGVDLESNVTKTIGDYLSVLTENPEHMMPLGLPEKGSLK